MDISNAERELAAERERHEVIGNAVTRRLSDIECVARHLREEIGHFENVYRQRLCPVLEAHQPVEYERAGRWLPATFACYQDPGDVTPEGLCTLNTGTGTLLNVARARIRIADPVKAALAMVDECRAELLRVQGEFGESDVSSERDAYLGALENLADAVRGEPARDPVKAALARAHRTPAGILCTADHPRANGVCSCICTGRGGHTDPGCPWFGSDS